MARNVILELPDYGGKGSADRAMSKMRVGGTYLVVPGGEGGKISSHPKAGVRQLTFRGTVLAVPLLICRCLAVQNAIPTQY